MLSCAICGKGIFTEDPKKFFCRDCYKQWESDILAKADWIRFCVNCEHQQRRQAFKDKQLIYLGNEFDVSFFNGEYSLAPTREYYDEWD